MGGACRPRTVEPLPPGGRLGQPQDLSYRIPEQNLPRELDSLARSFNHMLGRLEDGVRQLSQFSDDLAH